MRPLNVEGSPRTYRGSGEFGAPAHVLTWNGATGTVRSHGEVWRARSSDRGELPAGAETEVVAIDRSEDMVLIVAGPTEHESDHRESPASTTV
jgi:membrane-bound ClpP family serine protease